MTVIRPFLNHADYQGVTPIELGRQYVKATEAGRLDIVAEIDLFVFESGQFGDSDIDEFLTASAEVEEWELPSCAGALSIAEDEEVFQFEDEQLAQVMISCGINPF